MNPNRLLSSIFVGTLLFCTQVAAAQWHAPSPVLKDAAWHQGLTTKPQARETVAAARAVQYDHAALVGILAEAPQEFNAEERTGQTLDASGCRLALPFPSDDISGWTPHPFRIVRSDVMAPELTAKYPEISSYLVQSERNGLISGRIDLATGRF